MDEITYDYQYLIVKDGGKLKTKSEVIKKDFINKKNLLNIENAKKYYRLR